MNGCLDITVVKDKKLNTPRTGVITTKATIVGVLKKILQINRCKRQITVAIRSG
jgi:hypothetical protein